MSDLGFKMWRQAEFFGCEASLGNQINARCGRIGTFISPKIKHMINNRGTIGVNEVQWIWLLGLPRGDLAVLNVYAPQIVPDKCSL